MSLDTRIKEKEKTRGRNYVPRTRHLNPDGTATYTNRLFLEESPYLLQHAHNPVDWSPWGEEAFSRARATNRPLFVSIGYATCHWCHVMEEESFEDEEIAEVLNTHFIPVKVDREERPDIDAIYMNAVQLLTGAGGWPLNVFLTPEGKPFYCGTYFPARDGDRPPHTGFLTLLHRISDLYATEEERISDSALKITQALHRLGEGDNGGALPDRPWVETAIATFADRYDPRFGGSRGAPKFPSTLPVSLLLRAHQRTGISRYLHRAEHTLSAMANGGIHDQVGGGFHRYSTDEKWLAPHFEKMLYDNALLAATYVEGFQATGTPRFKKVAETTLDYLLREMESPKGGFYSATDADSLTPSGEKEEGYFFTWSRSEIDAALPEDPWAPVRDHFTLTGPPHFEGRYIPHIQTPLSETAKKHGLTEEELSHLVDNACQLLRGARTDRKAPLTDTKIIAAWNGLTLSAFARAGRAFNNATYLNAADRTARFILSELTNKGRLHRSRLEGLGPLGFLEDYAFVIAGLIDLFEATGEKNWVEAALHLQAETDRLFSAKDGGYLMTGIDGEILITPDKPATDGAIPSGNSVAAMNLFRLYALTTDTTWLKKGLATVSTFIPPNQDPAPYSGMITALDFHLSEPLALVLLLPENPSPKDPVALSTLASIYTPYAAIIPVREGAPLKNLKSLLPLIDGKTIAKESPTLYPCRNGTCNLPVSDLSEFRRVILDKRNLPPAARG
ncbi:thioredoxin domain-containing protein [Desulfoluna sp.]|uniref:thioredoxin domain-containing protein n=1 Tax=Desulfoluna sp. TaxID=2045199 RepID=UPI0026115E0F|nr:thioredoxin domain-containing protein [Desulfoluna sp.]